MGNLDNCSECGTLFVRTTREVCSDCSKKIEKEFETVYQFVRKRENRMAKVAEVAEGTGVEETRIQQFIREGRLKQAQFPNLTYPCQSCSSPIKEGRLCLACQGKLRQGMDIMQHENELAEKKRRAEQGRGAYHSKG